ncbi:MAG: hypothetical protein JJU15_01220 [Pararhodobacter sp.]|nr:hypothetical protein [Pararhodobacter sp.]
MLPLRTARKRLNIPAPTRPDAAIRRGGAITICATLLAAGVLAGCKEDSAENGQVSADTTALQSELDALEDTQSVLRFAGAVTATGAYTTADDPRYAGRGDDVFRPATGGRAANARRGSNADGPYAFTIYTDAVHHEDADNVVRAWASFVMPEGAGPGTYALASVSDSSDNEAQVSVAGDGYAWQFARGISGVIMIEEIGDTLSAAWTFEAHGRGGDQIEVTGAVRSLPFSPQPEAQYTLSADDETLTHFGRMTSRQRGNGRITLLLGPGIYFDLPPDPEPGAHPIHRRRNDDRDITANLTDFSIDTVDGEMTLERDGASLAGRFALTATGEDTLTLEGTFDTIIADMQ